MRENYLERFEENYTPEPNTGCWLWTGIWRTQSGKYGALSVNAKLLSAHRLSWEITNGEIPEGMFVCHKCDTPQRVNPNHLFIGTHLDNMRDCARKGRTRKKKSKGSLKQHAKKYGIGIGRCRTKFYSGF